jgi:hypothetical protein
VTRLRGKLDEEAFRRSVASVVLRHDALRTRIVLSDGAPVQEIDEGVDWQLRIEDLTTSPKHDRGAQLNWWIENIVLSPIDLAKGPLFEARLLRVQDEEHVLIVAMEHIIADMWSLDVFFRDVLKAYAEARQGREPSLSRMPIQFSDYAFWQRNQQGAWLEEHGPYWKDRLSGCGRLRFPLDDGRPDELGAGWAIAPVELDGSLTTELRDWCRTRRTTLVMSIFTAYIALVLRWCNVLDAVVRFESNGRFNPQVAETIGYFTAPLFLRVRLHEHDSLDVLLDQVTIEYCKVLEHADSSYLEAHVPRPDFTRNTAFNWIPRLSGQEGLSPESANTGLTFEAVPFENPRLKRLERDTEPFAMFFENDAHIEGGIWFPADRFSTSTMQRFGRHFATMVRALVRSPGQPVNEILLSR